MVGWLVGAGAIAALDWLAIARGSKVLEYACKPATMLALVGVALALDPRSATARGWFVVALLLSMMGDIFLMLPRDLFIPGLASFLLAHIAYVVGLRFDGGSAAAVAASAVVVAVITFAVARPIIRAVWRGDDRSIRAPVVLYMFVIATMVTSALASGHAIGMVGAVLFFASDATIAWNRFVRSLSWAPLFIIVTYHLGQAGLVLSLAR